MPARRQWIEAGLWLGFQLLLTSVPGSSLPSEATPPDVVAHAGVYGVLSVLLVRAGLAAGWPRRRLVLAFAGVAVLGAVDELHQRFIPGRDAAVADWFADITGAALGFALGFWLMRTRFARWLR